MSGVYIQSRNTGNKDLGATTSKDSGARGCISMDVDVQYVRKDSGVDMVPGHQSWIWM
jgi:hypothetical protein